MDFSILATCQCQGEKHRVGLAAYMRCRPERPLSQEPPNCKSPCSVLRWMDKSIEVNLHVRSETSHRLIMLSLKGVKAWANTNKPASMQCRWLLSLQAPPPPSYCLVHGWIKWSCEVFRARQMANFAEVNFACDDVQESLVDVCIDMSYGHTCFSIIRCNARLFLGAPRNPRSQPKSNLREPQALLTPGTEASS